jgi:dihydroceramidase
MLATAGGEHGFWGAPTAIHQFCEPKYATSPYFAEFWNSVSSIWYVLAALYALSDASLRADTNMVVASIAAAAIGLGSAAFHGTMLYEYELCDEVPMLIFISICMINKCGCHPWLLTTQRKVVFSVGITCTCAVTIAVYAFLQIYEFFIASFTFLVVLDLGLALTWNSKQPLNWFAVKYSMIGLGLGKFFWEIEVRSCHTDERVWPLHVAWHLGSALSVYWGLLADMTARIECGVSPMAKGGKPVPLRWHLVPFSEVTVRTHKPSSILKNPSAHAQRASASPAKRGPSEEAKLPAPKRRPRPVTGTRAKRNQNA